MLEVRHLHVSYGNIQAVRGVNLDVPTGKVVALIGNNGAGKSTTLRAISGLLRPTRGAIRFEGRDITGAPPHLIARAGIIQVPEGRRIFSQLTVRENLIMATYARPKRTSLAGDLERVFSLFPILRERQHQLGGTLSGGEQQMLAIARALLSQPRLLLLDEPSMGLAPILVERIYESIEAVRRQGTTILLVEQNAQMALAIADYGYVMEAGEVMLEGPAGDLRHNDQVRRVYLGES